MNADVTSAATPGVALITGAAQRIGRAIALGLAADGWAVAVHYGSSADAAAETAAEIRAGGGEARVFEADLADEAQVAALIPAVADAMGPVTCLVNNASVFELDTIADTTRESWDRHMTVNLRAPFLLIQSFAAARAGGDGNVVNILDQRVWNLTPYFSSYTLSKAALWVLTRTAALALAPAIRVNGVGPGPTLPSPRQDKAQFERQWKATPLARPVTPEDVAGAVRFVLASPTMTGQMIALDSGQHLNWSPGGGGTDE